jgi:hypothetical protein
MVKATKVKTKFLMLQYRKEKGARKRLSHSSAKPASFRAPLVRMKWFAERVDGSVEPSECQSNRPNGQKHIGAEKE